MNHQENSSGDNINLRPAECNQQKLYERRFNSKQYNHNSGQRLNTAYSSDRNNNRIINNYEGGGDNNNTITHKSSYSDFKHDHIDHYNFTNEHGDGKERNLHYFQRERDDIVTPPTSNYRKEKDRESLPSLVDSSSSDEQEEEQNDEQIHGQVAVVKENKLDELFKKWFSLNETRNILHSDLETIKIGASHLLLQSVCQQQSQSPPLTDSPPSKTSINSPERNKIIKINLPLSPTKHQSSEAPHSPAFPNLHLKSTAEREKKKNIFTLDPLPILREEEEPKTPKQVPSPILEKISTPTQTPNEEEEAEKPKEKKEEEEEKDYCKIISSERKENEKDCNNNNEEIPLFYFPTIPGKEVRPPTALALDTIASVKEQSYLYNGTGYDNFGNFLAEIGFPKYWKLPFWITLGFENVFRADLFFEFYQKFINICPDDSSKFLYILISANKNFKGEGKDEEENYSQETLSMSDFIPLVEDIIHTHPGLAFLNNEENFHERYITTVISRIFYKVNRSWSGKISLIEIRRSNLLDEIKRLEEENDVNVLHNYFSYEHFYVIYCKFWELDQDHDLLIDVYDLMKYANKTLSTKMIKRIFDGTVLRGWDLTGKKHPSGKMTYSDFVWFILSEEEKVSPTAIEYWFRCIDLDGDGIITAYELEYFYQEQKARLDTMGILTLEFPDIYCLIIDQLNCSQTGIRLKDLKRNPRLSETVLNSIINHEKYLDYEQKDPFVNLGSEGTSDWTRFAATEYENYVSEGRSSSAETSPISTSDFSTEDMFSSQALSPFTNSMQVSPTLQFFGNSILK